MAKGASKRISSQNASSLTLLTRGFILSNLAQILSLTLFTSVARRHTSAYKWDILKYVVTEVIAVGIALVMRDMAVKGEDLNAEGLTALMWDVVFVTWAVHVGTAFVWRRLWWLYAVIPLYGIFLLYTKLIVPFILGGRDPIAGIVASFTGGRQGGQQAQQQQQQQPANAQEAEQISKRQKKLQARAERGDPRVQSRQVKRGGGA